MSSVAVSVLLLLVTVVDLSAGIDVTLQLESTYPPTNNPPQGPVVIGPGDNYSILNATFKCTAPGTSTLWRVGGYYLVDRDEFSTNGLSALDEQQGISRLVFGTPSDPPPNREEDLRGFPFVFEYNFDEKCCFEIACVPVLRDVDVRVCYEDRIEIASCYCIPETALIALESSDEGMGGPPTVRVIPPENFNELVNLNYTFTINNSNDVSYENDTSNASFNYTIEAECGEGCEICVRAQGCRGPGPETCVTVSDGDCVASQPNITCVLGTSTCSPGIPDNIVFELRYKGLCDMVDYIFYDGVTSYTLEVWNGTVEAYVTVPLNSPNYTVSLMACANQTCWSTSTTLPDNCDQGCEDCEDDNLIFIIIIIIIAVLSGLCFILLVTVIAVSVALAKKMAITNIRSQPLRGEGKEMDQH